MTSAKHPCDMGIGFYVGECPDYGSMSCPKTVPGAKCGVDVQYARELLECKARWYAKRSGR